MNKIKSINFIEKLLYLLLITIALFAFLVLVFSLAMILKIKMPDEPTISVIAQINYVNLFKLFIYIGIVFMFIFAFIEMFVLFRVRKEGRKIDDLTTKESRLIEILFRVLLGSYIPVVALLAFTKSQFSSLVDISALFAIFIFFFNFGKTPK